MITVDDEGNLIFLFDAETMEHEQLIDQYLAMDEKEFDRACDAINMLSDAWNEAQTCRVSSKEGH